MSLFPDYLSHLTGPSFFFSHRFFPAISVRVIKTDVLEDEPEREGSVLFCSLNFNEFLLNICIIWPKSCLSFVSDINSKVCASLFSWKYFENKGEKGEAVVKRMLKKGGQFADYDVYRWDLQGKKCSFL